MTDLLSGLSSGIGLAGYFSTRHRKRKEGSDGFHKCALSSGDKVGGRGGPVSETLSTSYGFPMESACVCVYVSI